MAGSDTDSDANVSTLALNAPSADESTSTTVAAPMEVHRRTWHCLNLFRPPYVCGQCHKTVYLWCMHCEGCGFCLHLLECPVCGRAHPSTDKWLFQKWCQEVDVEEVLTATLPNEPVSGDEELDVLSNPLLASPPGKEVKKKGVQSSDSEVDLFAPPPTAPVPKKKAKGKKVLPKAPPIDPPNPQRRTRSTIPSETTPLGVGDLQQKKKLHDLPQKLKNSIFFYNSHHLQQKKKLHAFTAKKKLHDYTVFLYTTYIFHDESTAK